ncbi:hypothetical protein NDU88_005069 [Pleurodeles waltl]|uniref:Uncharacterized protein n=1 Tax=Pleurodeles waltl TaxID=8319 RepID=A0AAV7QJZ0_PLEWA|nr:hypothetical protein NDU88_005069 [Pleurodeles waltl]
MINGRRQREEQSRSGRGWSRGRAPISRARGIGQKPGVELELVTQIAQPAVGRTKGKHKENGEASGPSDPTLEILVKYPADKLDLILQEIKDSRQAIENRLGSITAELNILRDDK